VAKLRAIVAGVDANEGSLLLSRVNSALTLLTPVVKDVNALLSGEPATALPGMAVTNQASFPTATQPIVPPLREHSRADAARGMAPARTNDVEGMIEQIIRREGGFVNHPNDRGGPTNFGVTQRNLAAWRGRVTSVDDVRNMSVDEAKQIFRTNYYTRPKIDRLPLMLQPIVFDMSINHGPGTAIKLLQQVLCDCGHACDTDGGIGDETLHCARAAADSLGNTLQNRLVDRRVALFEAIVAGDASQAVFLRGWLNRANEFRVA
jgi:hypothetical protein